MKVTVLKRFRDKNTKALFEVGAETEYEAERAKELAELGYVKIKTEPKAEKKAPAKKAPAKKSAKK